jgi:hypothetical protein
MIAERSIVEDVAVSGHTHRLAVDFYLTPNEYSRWNKGMNSVGPGIKDDWKLVMLDVLDALTPAERLELFKEACKEAIV